MDEPFCRIVCCRYHYRFLFFFLSIYHLPHPLSHKQRFYVRRCERWRQEQDQRRDHETTTKDSSAQYRQERRLLVEFPRAGARPRAHAEQCSSTQEPAALLSAEARRTCVADGACRHRKAERCGACGVQTSRRRLFTGTVHGPKTCDPAADANRGYCKAASPESQAWRAVSNAGQGTSRHSRVSLHSTADNSSASTSADVKRLRAPLAASFPCPLAEHETAASRYASEPPQPDSARTLTTELGRDDV